MNPPSSAGLLRVAIGMAVVMSAVRAVRAQEAEVVVTIGRAILESLGKDGAEFGGEAAAQLTAKRLVTEATEAAGSVGGRVAKAQVGRILTSGREELVFDLKLISGKSLPLLEDFTDEALPSAVSTLARRGIDERIQALGSMALRKAALRGELRLPGAGLRLVEHYGGEGAELVTKLNEDQANSVIAALRPTAIKSLPSAERSTLLNALASRSDARVFNFERAIGPLVVVASGIVVWHGIDLALSPDERVTEQPDGTVVREKTGVASRVVQTIPLAVHELSPPLKWTGVTFAIGASLVVGIVLWRRQRRSRPDEPSDDRTSQDERQQAR